MTKLHYNINYYIFTIIIITLKPKHKTDYVHTTITITMSSGKSCTVLD